MVMQLGADGCVPCVEIDSTKQSNADCCPPSLCMDICSTVCSFIDILPCGPMWDYWKAAAISHFTGSPNCEPAYSDKCPSLVQHAIYVVFKLQDAVNALWVALRESNPSTAEVTLDAWLERLKWEDCYRQHCRPVLHDELTPYELPGPCGPVFCEFPFGDELECAIKRALVISLTRAQMGGVKNLCGINWIIEPLGAKLCPLSPLTDDCCDVAFEICKICDYLPGCLPAGAGPCDPTAERPMVPAWTSYGCNVPAGLPETIWPGVVAAECIVRSLMPHTCKNNITRCC
jgi:hypothetical protein